MLWELMVADMEHIGRLYINLVYLVHRPIIFIHPDAASIRLLTLTTITDIVDQTSMYSIGSI